MDSKLLHKFFKGDCSPAEVKIVLEWFKSNQHKEQLAAFWEDADENKHEYEHNNEVVLTRIKTAINYQEHVAERVPENQVNAGEGTLIKMRPDRWQFLLKVAAVLLLPLCFLIFFAKNIFNQDNTAEQIVTIQTKIGERKKVRLADGSRITLNSKSKISYHKDYNQTKRVINLAGEAFFQVAKDSLRPFIVKTGLISTQALGTSFNITFRPNLKEIKVALVTGSVAVSRQIQDKAIQVTKLKPGENGNFSKTDAQFRVSLFNPKEVLGWQQNILYFKKASLKDVVARLENWYHVRIILSGNIPDSAQEWSYTGEYQNQSLENVLSGIGFVKDFAFEKKENSVLLKFK